MLHSHLMLYFLTSFRFLIRVSLHSCYNAIIYYFVICLLQDKYGLQCHHPRQMTSKVHRYQVCLLNLTQTPVSICWMYFLEMMLTSLFVYYESMTPNNKISFSIIARIILLCCFHWEHLPCAKQGNNSMHQQSIVWVLHVMSLRITSTLQLV